MANEAGVLQRPHCSIFHSLGFIAAGAWVASPLPAPPPTWPPFSARRLPPLHCAETNFKTQVEADIQPLRGILLGLFFVTTGSSLDVG